MRILVFAVVFMVSACFGRSLASIKKDAFIVGVNKGDSAAEYDFIAEITAKMKFSRFRLVCFENASLGQKMLLEGKIDAIISKINYSEHLKDKFLVSKPYSKMEIAVAVFAKNSEIWSLESLDGKNLAFVPKDISGTQISGIWRNSKPTAFKNIEDAISSLQSGETQAIIANRESLEAQKNVELKIFPNTIMENGIVALFAPNAGALKELLDKSIKNSGNYTNSENSGSDKKKRIDKIIKELEILRGELK